LSALTIAAAASHPASARFFSTGGIALSLLAASLAGGAAADRSTAVFLLSSLAFLLYHPIAVENRFYNTLLLGREFRYQAEFLKKLGTGTSCSSPTGPDSSP